MDNIKSDISAEAKKLIAQADDISEGFKIEKNAESLADWWIEWHYARTDITPAWTDSEVDQYFQQMVEELVKMGLPA